VALPALGISTRAKRNYDYLVVCDLRGHRCTCLVHLRTALARNGFDKLAGTASTALTWLRIASWIDRKHALDSCGTRCIPGSRKLVGTFVFHHPIHRMCCVSCRRSPNQAKPDQCDHLGNGESPFGMEWRFSLQLVLVDLIFLAKTNGTNGNMREETTRQRIYHCWLRVEVS